MLLCPGQRVMLTSNLWVSAGLVNGSLGQVVDIFYKSQHHPPQLSTFVVVNFQKYIGPAWDTNNPTFLPIPPIQRGGGRTQIPLKMAWALTIHKSQGMTLPKAAIDILYIFLRYFPMMSINLPSFFGEIQNVMNSILMIHI